VYAYEIVPEAREQVDGLPVDALAFYAEVIAFLELTPWEGLAYRADKPEGSFLERERFPTLRHEGVDQFQLADHHCLLLCMTALVHDFSELVLA
jgi:hypothetical protein